MTPPSVPSVVSGNPAVVLPPPSDPQAVPGTGTDGDKAKPFLGSHLLSDILQNTGRVPTHPLTAQPPKPEAPKKDVSPQAVKKGESFDKKAQEYYDKKNFKKALGYYKLALEQNPNDQVALLGRAKMEFATGDLLAAHDHFTDLLAADPGSQELKAMRSNLNGILLQNFQQMAPKVPEAKRPEFMQMVQSLILETTMDQASLTAHNLERTLDDLKGKEKELEAFHGKSKEEKEAACQMLLGMAMNTLDIAQLPQIDPEDAKLVPEKLGIVSKEIMGVLARFAAADSDPALKRLAPLFQAYQYLLDGKSAEAEASFRTVRDDGLKLLGDGDAAKGEQALKEKIAKATLALQANDPATAQQIIQGELPPGLADAYMFLKPMEDQRKRTLNLRAVGAWEEQIHSRYDEAKKNVSSIGKVWDGVWGNKNSVDKLSEKETAEINVVSAVRGRISTGKCSTIEEALKDIVATETDQEIKDGAAAALGLATAGLDSGMMPLSRLMKLSSGTTIDDSTAGTMMSLGKTMDNIHAFPKLRAFLFTAVQTNSTDMSKRAEAEIGLKKALEE